MPSVTVVTAAGSPVEIAARLNQYTPRSVDVIAEAPAAAAAMIIDRVRDVAAVPPPLSFRDRVAARAGTADLLIFRVGAELFGLALEAVEEAVEVDAVHPLPEGSAQALGVVELRGRMIPLVSAARPLGVAVSTAVVAMLVLRDGARRVGIAIDDVDDVIGADLGALGPSPDGDGGDGVLLAMARRGTDLVGVLDAHLLLAACLAESHTPETAE